MLVPVQLAAGIVVVVEVVVIEVVVVVGMVVEVVVVGVVGICNVLEKIIITRTAMTSKISTGCLSLFLYLYLYFPIN